MLPLSVRLLARRKARFARLQSQPRLDPTDTTRSVLADSLKCTTKQQTKRRLKQSQLRSGNIQSGGSPKGKKTENTRKPHSFRSTPRVPSNVMTREERILEVLRTTVYKEKASTPAVKDWPGENWETDHWGLDRLKPLHSDQDFIIEVDSSEQGSGESRSWTSGRTRKSGDVENNRRLEGVLTPLGSPVLQDVAPLTEHRPIATLSHNLDRVLFNPGVHWLQEPRSGVYNFTPWLQNIPGVNDFAFERLPPFVKSSRDKDLWGLAKHEGRMFGGSTSSLTGMLSQVYFLISGIRTPDASSLSRPFRHMPGDFTPGQRMPASVLLNYNDGVYAIDSAYSEKDDPDKNVLTWLGTLLEKFLTMPPEKFRRLLRDSPNPAVDSGEVREAYRYAKSRRFVMRSQLDCHDPRLPGTGVFDLKTRAALPVRMDVMNYKQHSTYLIRTLQGELESFEREYHDLMRSAFLKYGFQARIGNMDGILVAHHNTARIFGFRYIPLSEMDACLFGGEDRGEAVFEKCVLLLEEILMEVIRTFPEKTVRCLFETRDNGKLDVFIEPEAHDDSGGSPPIVHMVVESTSYVDGSRTDGGSAVAKSGIWELHWSITHTSLPQEEKERKLGQAKDRQWRTYSLPSGVSLEEMEEIWNQVDFGGKQQRLGGTTEASSDDGRAGSFSTPASSAAEREPTFNPSYFAPPSKNVMFLRKLSMKGKVDMEMMLEEMRGRPKLIWGEPEAYIDQVESEWLPTETEVVRASKVVGDPLAECGEVVPVDEDVKASEATASLADYSQAEEDKRR